MHEPDDFGLGAWETLAHVSPSVPPSGFGPYWSRWHERLRQNTPLLVPATEQDRENSGCEGVTHFVRSVGDARIGCNLSLPAQGEVRSAVISLHGYGVEETDSLDDPSPWLGEEGIAVVRVRVRGFPGSSIDVGNLREHPTGYITYGLESLDTWIIPDAVADVVNVVNAIRSQFTGTPKCVLHGESFGGGLAIIAASALAMTRPIDRLIVGLPSLGDWGWRLQGDEASRRRGNGSGREVESFVRSHRSIEDSIMLSLRMLDGVVHATRVVCPSIFKLAILDDVVPAPAAAAIYNALGTTPGLKWRFITRYGHFDGGIADARKHATFDRIACRFARPTVGVRSLANELENIS